MKKICCLLNYAPHYRSPIFQKMDQELHCDWYFGKDLREEIEKMDYSLLRGFKRELKNIYKGNWVWRKGVIELAFRKEYDTYIISGEPHTLSLIPFNLICLFLGKKVYSWQHGISNPAIGKGKLFNQRLLIAMQEGVFLYSEHAKNVMKGLGFKSDKLFVVYNSLDYKKSLRYRELPLEPLYSNYFGNEDPVLLFIGRQTKVKNLTLLIDAFVQLNKREHPCNLVIIGDGPMENKIKDGVRTSGLTDRCWFTGAIYDEEMIACYLKNATLCVSPGNVGLTAIHALSYGLPVVTNNSFATQMPEYEAIELGLSGDFFNQNDLESLIETITKWLFQNRWSREEIRINCYRRIDEHYNAEEQISVFMKVLNRSISDSI